MDKEAKKMNYAIEPIVKLTRDKMISDGGTRKKAGALEGRWIRLNETMFAFEEADTVTLIHSDGNSVGCACGRCDNGVMCEHLIAFEDLKSPPQLTIESPEFNWLKEYLFSLGWYAENRYLYPSLDAELPGDEDSWKPDEGKSTKLDPVNEDHDLDIGVDEEPEAKTYSRECVYCGASISDTDLEQVKMDIAEHTRDCSKNPANKKKEAPETQETATPKKTKPPQKAAVKEPPGAEKQKEEKKVKQSTAVTKTEPRTPAVKKEMPTEAEFQTTKVGRLMKSQGSIYRAGGKEVADSAAVSSYAVSSGVSTETIILEQTIEYARATVRAHKGGRYTDGSVLIRRDAILEKLMIDLAEKNPSWIIGWSNGLPEFDLDQTVFIGDKRKILGLHIAGVVADKWMFASRDCETKAGRRAQIKILGADWREDDEVESEVEEMKTVAKR